MAIYRQLTESVGRAAASHWEEYGVIPRRRSRTRKTIGRSRPAHSDDYSGNYNRD
jgi:hypothetical protein